MSTQQKSTAPVQRTTSSSSNRSTSSAPTPAPKTTGAAAARTAQGSSAAASSRSSSSSSSGSSSSSSASSSNSRWDSQSRKEHTSALASTWGEDKKKEDNARNASSSSNQKADVRYREDSSADEQGKSVDETGDIRNKSKTSTTDTKQTTDNKQTTDPKPVDEVKPEPKPEETKKKNDVFEQNRTQLLDAFKNSALDEPSMQRMGKMMGEFENRMASLAAMKIEAYQRKNGSCPPEMQQKIIDEAKQKVNDTYKHLTEMVGTKQGSGELFGQKERTSLAEGLMFHLADPRTMDQGSNGTCWINSSTASYGLMTQPDDMARFMKEISLTGQFQAYNNGQVGGSPTTIRFNKNQFYSTGQERNWSISNAIGGSARSPVGMFLDEAMTEMVGKRRADAGDYNGNWGAKRIMTMITGEAPPAPRGRLGNARTNRQMTQDDLTVALEYGGFQIYSPGHLQSVHFVPQGKFGWGENGSLTLNGNSMATDGSADMSGYFILDNQWGERSDFVTHHVNSNGQIQDIQDQRYQHFDPGKVSNERNIAINPGNDSGGGGGGGGGCDGGGCDGGGGGLGEGGLLGIIQAILSAIFGGGGAQAGGGDPASGDNWAQLLEQLVNSAEGECSSGAPGQGFDALEQSMPYLVGDKRPKQELMERIHNVLSNGAARRSEQAWFPDELDMLG